MTIRRPTNVGSTPDEAPEVLFELTVTARFDPTLSADELARLRDTAWDRLTASLGSDLAPFLHEPTQVDVTPVRGRGADTPLFPLVAGEARFTCADDLLEAVERRCEGTDLARIAYDVRGLAYELGVELDYVRRPELDGVRAAPLPDPAKVP